MMTTDLEHEPARTAASETHDWLTFPSEHVVNNRQIERWLAALIWLSMPFMLHLLGTAPGGFGALLVTPEYFIYAVIDVIVTVLLVYICVLALSMLLVHRQDAEAQRASRRATIRAWIDAIVSCFAVTAILLSISTWIAMNWLNTPVSTDAISWFVNGGAGAETWAIIYGYALSAALMLSAAIRWGSRRRTATWTRITASGEQPAAPNLLLVALCAYAMLLWAIYVTLYPFDKLFGGIR